MKPLFSVIAVALGLMSGLAAAQEIHWFNHYPDALAEARRTGKPLLVAFRCVP